MPVIPRSTNIPTQSAPCIIHRPVNVNPGFNVPSTLPGQFESNFSYTPDLVFNWELDEYEPFNTIHDRMGHYELPEDYDYDYENNDEYGTYFDYEGNDLSEAEFKAKYPQGELEEDEGDESPAIDPIQVSNFVKKNCPNRFNCTDHCHCVPTAVCFYCKLQNLNLKVECEKKG